MPPKLVQAAASATPFISHTETIEPFTVGTWGASTSAISAIDYWVSPKNLWVAGAPGGIFRTSTDGITWDAQTNVFAGGESVKVLIYSPTLDIGVAAGGASGVLSTTTNATSWTVRTSTFSGSEHIQGGAWCPSLAKFVICGYTGKTAWSSNGTTWNAGTAIGTLQLNTVAWSEELGLAVVGTSLGALYTSTDLANWTVRTSTFGTTSITRIIWSSSDNKFLCVGASGKMQYSSNGIDWTLHPSPPFGTGFIYDCAYSEALGVWYAGSGSANRLASAPTASGTWTMRDSGYTGSQWVNKIGVNHSVGAPAALFTGWGTPI